jgi:hypothetical protein
MSFISYNHANNPFSDILPHQITEGLDVLQGPWKGRVPADAGVVLEVDVGRVKSVNRSSHTDSGESALDSRCVPHVKHDDLLV